MKKKPKEYKCKDCEKKVCNNTALYGGGRCYSCAGKIKHALGILFIGQKGKNHPSYVDGRSLRQHFCKCGKKIYYQAKLCTSCTGKSIRGSNHPNWKGGKFKSTFGYILVLEPNHLNKDKYGYVREHRLVMEKKLGRYLESFEIVHHLNGIKDDNREENLTLVNNKNHEKYTLLKLAQKRIKELEKENSILRG